MSVQTLQTIESQDLSLAALYNDFYVVPSFQREYVWETEQVEQLLHDIYTEFTNDLREASSEYFIGSIVAIVDSDDTFELIDGQQRMTTTFLVLCAIRDHLIETKAEPISLLNGQIAQMGIDSQGRDYFRHRVTLQYEDSREILQQIAERRVEVSEIPQSTRSVRNIANAYQVIRAFLQDQFRDDTAKLRRFYAYFTRNVKLIRVKTISVAHALKVFETINDRGVGLDSMDLLKNLMFMHADQGDFDRLRDRWKELVDTLFTAKEKPLRFLRYFIFGRYGVERLKEEEIYVWFVRNEHQCGYRENPMGFVNELLDAAQAYVNFIGGYDHQKNPNRFLSNLRHLSGAARQHVILLLAARHLPQEAFDELCHHLENLFFAYLITREPTRDFERRFARWAGELKDAKTTEQFQQFLNRRIRPAKEGLAARFNLALYHLDERNIQQYRMRYVLGKLTQHVNEQAWGSQSTSRLWDFINNDVHVEHILTPESVITGPGFLRQARGAGYIHSLPGQPDSGREID